MWTYSQSTGRLSHDGAEIGRGYSGHGAGLDNPAMQAVANVGPIPVGQYEIGPAFDSETHGPICMRLTPKAGTDCCGRGNFLCHGDSIRKPGSASHGCVILARTMRLVMAGSLDRDLEVV